MAKAKAINISSSRVPVWRMPIQIESYPNREPFVTDQEAALLEHYARATPVLAGPKAQQVLDELHRFNQPFLDVIRLHAQSRALVGLANSRRSLFAYMAQTRTAFWAWEHETWREVIQTVSENQQAGRRFWVIVLAYLFSGFLYVGADAPYTEMAKTLFGNEVVASETDKLFAPLFKLGYSQKPREKKKLHHCYAMLALVCKSPYVETFTAQALITVNHLLAASPNSTKSRKTKREALMLLQTALCYLDILTEPAILTPKRQQPTPPAMLWQNDLTIDPTWAAWVCAFYEQTPHQNKSTLRNSCYVLLATGRWLKQTHPEINSPQQWDEALATEYTSFISWSCSERQMFDPTYQDGDDQETSRQLAPHTVSHHLRAMRLLFFHLQRRPYVVEEKQYEKLQLTWLPTEVFKTPDDIQAACQPNPRDIQEDTWFKLIWAACTLSKEQLEAVGAFQYPLAYYRAASLIWVTAARRSDEIRRLSLGCVRREWVDEMRDENGHRLEPAEELCYLRVPTNKMKGEFYVPIPAYVADAVEVWESVRPPHQILLEDRKTHKPTKYLFQYRNELMGSTFLNRAVIPLLCNIAGVSQTDVVGRITSHRARATTATWMRKMGMAPADIGKLLGHTNPATSLPWYLREDKHHLGRAYRKANPLERYVAAILDTNAHARQEPCVFYYLADGLDGRPRMCGNPHFSRCIHQMTCRECEAFIDAEMAEVIERREGAVIISVPIPLPQQVIDELNEQDESGGEAKVKLEALPPPTLPGPAFHFNKKVPLRSATDAPENISERLAQVEAQIAKKQSKADQRSASLRALLKERAELQARIET